jgi:Fe-S cluster assembly ATP-binding protein
MIEIKHLNVKIDEKWIIQDLSLKIEAGEIHVLMGLNGAGKSTLARVLAGDEAYEVVSGEIWFKHQNLLEMSPEARAHAGMFLSFQYPTEIPGLSNVSFLKAASDTLRKAKGLKPWEQDEFDAFLANQMEMMQIRSEFKERGVNQGFSGGEKKKNEILQMMLLEPDFLILDETDSGLDIDALRVVAKGVNGMRSSKRAMLIITHYQRLLDEIQPDFVHIMAEGKIVKSGDAQLALQLEEQGYALCTS